MNKPSVVPMGESCEARAQRNESGKTAMGRTEKANKPIGKKTKIITNYISPILKINKYHDKNKHKKRKNKEK